MVGVVSARVLLVEDDPTVRDVVTRYLSNAGLTVDAVNDGEAALTAAHDCWPDLVVLDLMLPRLDGFEVYRRLRTHGPVPVIMLTARGDEDDRVAGLELGADDYVAKPFSPRELTARVNAVLRRSAATAVADEALVIDVNGLHIDGRSREVVRDGSGLCLTAREFDLLLFLASSPGRVFRREELLEHVWGFTYGDTSTVTVHVRRIREKIERDPSSPEHIVTVWGVGYRWDTPGAVA
jgi:DNA-binding response OmpR family regulator